jgi:hypothetical protein
MSMMLSLYKYKSLGSRLGSKCPLPVLLIGHPVDTIFAATGFATTLAFESVEVESPPIIISLAWEDG